jgi:hypothetical protein
MTGFRTELGFDDIETRVEETSVVATASYQASPRWGFQLGAGVVLGGEIVRGNEIFDVGTGGTLSVAASHLPVYETARRPFLLVTLALAASFASAGDESLTAGDLRAGVMAGKTFGGVVTPYVTARVFGGSVFWTIAGDSVVGGDEHHYALGGGATLRLGRFDLFAELLPLGERSLTLGAGAAF